MDRTVSRAAHYRESLKRLEEITRRNVEAIGRIERDARRQGSQLDHGVEWLTSLCGTSWFFVLTISGVVLWVGGNGAGLFLFDPFPFPLLTMLVSLAGILLAILILITQNRQSRVTEQRHHLHLQLSLLMEQEVTRVLQVLTDVAGRVGLEVRDPQIHVMQHHTDPETLMEEISKEIDPG